MKKALCILLAAALILSLAACGSSAATTTTTTSTNSSSEAAPAEAAASAQETQAASDRNLTVAVRDDFGALDPYATAAGSIVYWRPAVYETLGYVHEYGGELDLCIAKSVTQVADDCWDIEIYDYIYDSEGNHITAEDIVYSYEYAKACGTVIKMANLKEIVATGDYTVRLTASNTNLGTYEQLMTQVIIVNKESYQAAGESYATKAIGTGPYVMTQYISGSTLELTKRDYWQTDESLIDPAHRANADSVKFMVISDPAQQAIALESGEIDAIVYINGASVNYFIDDAGNAVDGYVVSSMGDPLIYNFYPNLDGEQSVLKDNLKLRQAIFHAIDRSALVSGPFDNKAVELKTHGCYLYGDYNTQWDSEEYFDYDPELAKTLIAESGFDTTQTLRLMTENTSPFKEIGEVIQGYLIQVGLNVELLAYDTALYAEYKNDSTQWDLKIAKEKSPDLLPNIWGYAFNAANYQNYGANFNSDPVLQEKLAAVSAISTHSIDTINDFHYYLKDNAYVLGLVCPLTYSIATSAKFNSIFWNGALIPIMWASDLK